MFTTQNILHHSPHCASLCCAICFLSLGVPWRLFKPVHFSFSSQTAIRYQRNELFCVSILSCSATKIPVALAAATAGWETGQWGVLMLRLSSFVVVASASNAFALLLRRHLLCIALWCFVYMLHSPLLHSFRRPCVYLLSSFRWFSCCRRCVATIFSSTPLTFSFVILNLTLRYSMRWYYGFECSSSQLLCLPCPQPNEAAEAATAEANVMLEPEI